MDEKVICLSIMKQSSKCYRFLSKIFILPSKSTLNEMIANLIIEPGINPQVFNLLKKEVGSSGGNAIAEMHAWRRLVS